MSRIAPPSPYRTLDAEAWRRHRLRNALQSLLLLIAMGAVLCGLGWVIGGGPGAVAAVAAGCALVLLSPGLSPRMVLLAYGARELDARSAPGLVDLVERLARGAGLPAAPRLFYVPSTVMNAFAVGTRAHSAIAVSDGLLRALSARELAAVLAHEVSHVSHNDTWVMGLADLFSRMTSVFATLGQVLVLVNLPLLALSGYTLSWAAIAILLFAPGVSALMQLALSRTREYDADLRAAALTGDPRGLALALDRMERYQGRFLEQVLLPGNRIPDPSLLRPHPPTADRVRRLLALEPMPAGRRIASGVPALAADDFPAVVRRPRRRASGVWY